jgi:hypothetical protein
VGERERSGRERGEREGREREKVVYAKKERKREREKTCPN